MTDRIASEDIIEVNDAGQSVVVVPAGQPIPEGVQDKSTPKTEDKSVDGPKARRARKSS